MTYIDDYKRRVSANGNKISDAFLNTTNGIIKSSFKDSPSYRLATIDNIDVDIRVMNTDTDNIKKVAFMPDYKVNVGKIIRFDNQNWLITEYHTIKTPPTAKVILCNKTLNYKGLSGLIPCVYSNATFYSLGIDETKLVTVPDGKVSIMVELSEKTKDIYNGMRFIFDKRNVYETTFVNSEKANYDNLTGYLIITMQQNAPLPQDDLQNNIAYNDSLKPAPTDNLMIQGLDSLMINKQGNYSVVYDNGNSLNLTFDWSLELDYTLANIISSDLTSCILKVVSSMSASSGVVRLVARCRENGTVVSKDITIKKTLW